MDFETQMLALNEDLQKAYHNMDMSQEVFDNVIERTGNFREGFFASKRFRDLARASVKEMYKRQQTVTVPADLVDMMTEIVQDINNISATILSEADRLDS